jgi:predicted nuclease of predicted toxin-antitoxin system
VTLWLDNQLPPALSHWVTAALGAVCVPVRDLGLQRAADAEIFQAAHAANATVLTKDADFAAVVGRATATDRSRDLREHFQCSTP